jgi:flagellar basal-body rod protein FlgF
MGETTLIDLSRLMVLRRKLDVAANNVANAETTGFRAQHLSFQEYLKPEKGQEVGVKPERPLSLVDAAFSFPTSLAGAVQTTGNPLDLAINGDAYFAIQTAQGERYTRDGSFSLDGTGRLVTMDGQPVLGESGAITVPLQAGEIRVDAKGQVSTKQALLGRLRLVEFSGKAHLEAVGGNLFRADRAPDATKAGIATVVQGAIEKSNAQPTVEMSRLIEINRSYELTSKLLKDAQDLTGLSKLANVPD